MSLNYLEIDALLDELPLKNTLIQGVRQSSFKHLILSLYSKEEGRFELLFAFSEEAIRFHKVYEKEGSMAKPPRFCEYLRANLVGAKIEEVKQLQKERIVSFKLQRESETRYLFARLWTGRANLLYTTESGEILDLLFRRPNTDEVPGNIYEPEKSFRSPSGDPLTTVSIRFEPYEGEYGHAIARHYDELEKTKDLRRLKLEIFRDIDRKIKNQESRLAQLESEKSQRDEKSEPKEGEATESERNQHFGDLLLNNVHRSSSWKETGFILVADYAKENQEVRIALNPHLSLEENATSYYRKAKRGRKRNRFDSDEQSSRQERLQELIKKREWIESSEDIDYLKREVEKFHTIKKEQLKVGLAFDSHDFVLYLGRNAKENDHLLRYIAKGNDLWMHTQGGSSGFIIIRTKRNKSVPLPVLCDAAQLVVHYSKMKEENSAEVIYTAVKNVRQVKGPERGKVTYSFEKSLVIQPDRKLVQEFLSQKNTLSPNRSTERAIGKSFDKSGGKFGSKPFNRKSSGRSQGREERQERPSDKSRNKPYAERSAPRVERKSSGKTLPRIELKESEPEKTDEKKVVKKSIKNH